MKNLCKQAGFFAILLGLAASAHASCRFTISAISFGNYVSAQTTVLDASGTVVVTCTRNNENVTLSVTAGGSGNSNARTLQSGTNRLNYQLYLDPGRTQPAMGAMSTGISGRDDTIPYYARVFANQDVAPGAYTDTLTVTLTP